MPSPYRVFLSYDPSNDKEEIDEFFERFGSAAEFLRRERDLSDDLTPAEIRKSCIQDAPITLVLNGTCTHAKRDVDWEIQASLEPAEDGLPNGLLTVTLDRNVVLLDLPPRMTELMEWGYARFYRLPLSVEELQGWFDEALRARSAKRDRIKQRPERLLEDLECKPTFSPWRSRGAR